MYESRDFRMTYTNGNTSEEVNNILNWHDYGQL